MLKYLDEFRDTGACEKILAGIKRISRTPLNIMEVCGGHTMAIRKSGIQKLVGENIRFISGPGCPVCVTSIRDIDKVMKLAKARDVIVCSFGDLMNVPGSFLSLNESKALGADVRMVYSINDVLDLARKEPNKRFVFVSIGFETTAPLTAAAIIRAKEDRLLNFNVLSLNKTMPSALKAVLSSGASGINALLCPGHVSTVTGPGIYRPIVDDIGIPCCVSGFEPVDILRSVYLLTELHESGRKELVNAYERVVNEEGNPVALEMMSEVFDEVDSEWRGFGIIEKSGLRIKDSYSDFDAEKFFDLKVPAPAEEKQCLCGEILRGSKKPVDCSLFGTVCTPLDPRGACMVSNEGTCAAWYKYADR